jgi:hypothetical protein
MKLRLVTCALGFTASAALMAGCSSGSSSFGTPSGVTPSGFHSPRTISINGRLITAAHPKLRMRSHVAPVTPDRHHELNGLYQYVSNFYNSDLVEFDYPKGDPLSREIFSDEPQGECGDALYGVAKRDFWVVASGADEIEDSPTAESARLRPSAKPRASPRAARWIRRRAILPSRSWALATS